LTTQLEVLTSEGVNALELRGAWGTNVLDLSDEQLQDVRELLHEHGFAVSAIGSPIGKSNLAEPRAFEQIRLERALAVADQLDTRLIRIFSFYAPPETLDDVRDEVVERLSLLVGRAARAGATLLLENERGIYGENALRCHDLLATINSPALRMAFDPANFVQVGVRPMDEVWPLLKDYVRHVHIKDALFRDASVQPAGQGDGDIPVLLAALNDANYSGYLTLEPHLSIAGPAGGYSGESGMRAAIHTLKGLLASLPQ
jgi:3-dehydroshikimate dehydratase